MNHEPWNAIRQIAERTAQAYEPGDDSEGPGRCDLQLVQDALYAARLAVEGARDTPGDGDAREAVGELLHVLHRVLSGLSGDIRGLAGDAQDAADGGLGTDELAEAVGELADDLVALREPKP